MFTVFRGVTVGCRVPKHVFPLPSYSWVALRSMTTVEPGTEMAKKARSHNQKFAEAFPRKVYTNPLNCANLWMNYRCLDLVKEFHPTKNDAVDPFALSRTS
jgi:hypothetical protein